MHGRGTESIPTTRQVSAGNVGPLKTSRQVQRHSPLERLLLVVMVVAGFGDLPGKLHFERLSLLGFLTVLAALALSGALLLCRSYPRHLLLRLSPSLAFLLWVGFRSIWTPPDFYGFQQILVHVVFSLCLVSAGLVAARNPDAAMHVINLGVRWMSLPALGLVSISLITGGSPELWLIGPRLVALLGLVLVSWYLTKLYFGVPHSWAPISVWLGVIIVSSSRTATAAAILLITLVTSLKFLRRRRGVLVAVCLMLSAAGGTAFLFSRVPYFRDRLLTGDTGYVSVGDVGINVNGRVEVWEEVARSARESPIFGKGVGSASVVVGSFIAGLGHPHNDYLRLWHDVGFVGLGLFLFALFTWAAILLREWYAAEKQRGAVAYLALAGLLALLSLMAGMTTDNSVVYAGVMASSGILIGAGLGAGAQTRTQRTRINFPVKGQH